MRIFKTQPIGMCFGVQRALEIVDSLDRPDEVTLDGELVHNEQVVERLRTRGFHFKPESNRSFIPKTPYVLITAHGTSDKRKKQLEQGGKKLIDATCPFVQWIHKEALDLQRKDYFVIVIGKRGHIEVQGIIEDLKQYAVVEYPEEVKNYAHARLGIICQSTTGPDRAEAVLSEIVTRNPGREILYRDTICRATQKRQQAVKEIAQQVEALIVVGGKNSNNTRQLICLGEACGLTTFPVQTAEDLNVYRIFSFESVGLTAGTSTPDWVIEEVYQKLLLISENKSRYALQNI